MWTLVVKEESAAPRTLQRAFAAGHVAVPVAKVPRPFVFCCSVGYRALRSVWGLAQ